MGAAEEDEAHAVQRASAASRPPRDRDPPRGRLDAQGRLFRDRLRRLPCLGRIRRSRASPSTIASRWPRFARADGAFLLGEMAQHTFNAGQIYFPAGTPDPTDIFDGKVDLEASARRELLEETGISADEASVAPGWTLVFTPQRIACMKLMTLAVPAATLKARIDAYLARDPHAELSRMHIVREPARHRRIAGAGLRRRLPARCVCSKIGRITVTLSPRRRSSPWPRRRGRRADLRGGVRLALDLIVDTGRHGHGQIVVLDRSGRSWPIDLQALDAAAIRGAARVDTSGNNARRVKTLYAAGPARLPKRRTARLAGDPPDHADLSVPLSLRDDGRPRSRKSRTTRR